MSDIKSLLKQYEEVNAELNKQIRENGEVFITQVFQEIFDQNKGLKYIHIIGWTPGFNDGKPCTHSQESYVGASHNGWQGKLYYDFDERELYDEFEVVYEEEDSDTVVSHINSECQTLNQVASQIAVYDEIIERVYDTNFELKITLNENGKVVVDQDWYDCGF